jgi:hypothetical protein
MNDEVFSVAVVFHALGIRAVLGRTRAPAQTHTSTLPIRHAVGLGNNAKQTTTPQHQRFSLTGLRSRRGYQIALPFTYRSDSEMPKRECRAPTFDPPWWMLQPLPLRSLAARSSRPFSRCFGLQNRCDEQCRWQARHCQYCKLEPVKPCSPCWVSLLANCKHWRAETDQYHVRTSRLC